MQTKSFWKMCFLMIVLGLLLVACSKEESGGNVSGNKGASDVVETGGGQGTNQNETQAPPPPMDDFMDKPIELNVYYPYSDSSYEGFMTGYGELINKKYPKVTFTWQNAKVIGPLDLLVTNEPVDLVYGAPNMLYTFKEAQNVLDLDPLIKKYNFDLNRVEPSTLELVRDQQDHELMGLAAYINTHILFYNHSLFDRFGVQPPKNGMTWDEIYNIARAMTRKEDGVQYLGFNYYFLTGTFFNLNPYALSWVEPGTNKVTMSEGKWPEIFKTFERIYAIDGMEDIRGNAALDVFNKEERIAMLIRLSNGVSSSSLPEGWDITSFPVFEDNPGVGAGIEPIYFFIPRTSKKVDEAFMAISAMLSDEAQIDMVKRGRLPSVKLPNKEQIYKNEVPFLEGRNAEALFYNQFPPAMIITQEMQETRAIFGQAFTAVIGGEKDVNTALREATEAATNKLKELEMSK